MVKTNMFSNIEIWSADYINKTEMRSEKDKDAEVIQAERANHNGTMFIVEVLRAGINDMYPRVDTGIIGRHDILLCKEDKNA